MLNLLLADFSVIRPDLGLIFWTTLVFLLVWFLLGRLAFRPIQNALRKRENDIQEALDVAARARAEMAQLNADNERLLVQAREERTRLLQDAERERSRIVEEARGKAREEAQKIVANAKQDIENQRKAAVTDLKNQVGNMAVEIAEKILRRELENKTAQEQYVNRLVDDIHMS